MFYLLETPVGLALFKKNENVSFVSKYLYGSSNEAIRISELMNTGVVTEEVIEFLSKSIPKSSKLNVQNPEICKTLSQSLNITVVDDLDEDFRRIRKNAFKWFDVPKNVFNIMTVRMAHKMIKSSQDDLILIDMLNSIEEMETSINNRIMRVREWYSLHFPELNTVQDNTKYLEYLLEIQNRSEFCSKVSKDSIIPEDIVYKANNSMGTDITSEDIERIVDNVKNILEDIKYKNERQLLMKQKCMESFPNLFNLSGEWLSIKLIRKAGSISQLSQCPSSTIQIFGAEKAFNEAIKTKSNTPKYGMIFESSLVSKGSDENKGKIARMLANKIALCSKVDAANDERSGEYGLKMKKAMEKLIEKVEDKNKANAKEVKQAKRKIITVKEYDVSKDFAKKPKQTQ